MAVTVCYGDSNTYGWDPRDFFGTPYDSPWPSIFARLTGDRVINLGEPGRDIPSSSMRQNIMRSQLERAGEFDRIIVLLGTNDILNMMEPDADFVCEKMSRMLDFLLTLKAPEEIILLGLPEINTENKAHAACVHELNINYEKLARAKGIVFVDTSSWQLPLAFDGIHLTEEAHVNFGVMLSGLLPA